MLVNFNGNIIKDSELGFDKLYRAAMFGDGLFESVYLEDKEIYLLPEHLLRLNNGMKHLKLSFDKSFSTNDWIENIVSVIPEKEKDYSLRIRIMVWRKGAGTYNTSNQISANFIIFCEPCDRFKVLEIKKISFSENIKLGISPLSGNKTISGINYVKAAIEKDENDLDEILIKNQEGQIVEAAASNIICIKNETAFIPENNRGQVNGIMNKFLLEFLSFENVKIMESELSMKFILSSDLIIFCNSFIIKYINNKNSSGFIQIIKDLKTKIPKLPLPL